MADREMTDPAALVQRLLKEGLADCDHSRRTCEEVGCCGVVIREAASAIERLAQENERLTSKIAWLEVAAGNLRDSLVAAEKTRDEYYAMLKAQTLRAQRMQTALKMVEWVGDGEGFMACPWCDADRDWDDGHASDCPRQLALGIKENK